MGESATWLKRQQGRAVQTPASSTDSVVKEDADVNKVVPLVQDEDNNCPGPGDVVVCRVERIDDVHLDDQLARQLEAELDAEYEMEIASRAPAASATTGLVHGVIDISDDESNDEVDMKEWSDDPEHAKLSETDRKLREQELQDPDVMKMYQEMYDKNDDVQVDKSANEDCRRWQANIEGRAYIGGSQP
ncbi:hypothetical protein TRIUR3_24541 [Triticum urartu]|uniref:Uncharacterized protein n=1 Tax=Triticum urartu TaxID=4572 RepID=M7YTD9_TRIUA|nr:hypothetical protein TRIUR3_24541 [Triticum urartu]